MAEIKNVYPKTLKEFTDILMIIKDNLDKKKKMDPKGLMYGYMTNEWIEKQQKEFNYLMENDLLDDYKIQFYDDIPYFCSSDLHKRWVMNVPIKWLGG